MEISPRFPVLPPGTGRQVGYAEGLRKLDIVAMWLICMFRNKDMRWVSKL